MKYNYFVSYMIKEKTIFTFDNAVVSSSKKIKKIEDIERIENKILEDRKEYAVIKIINLTLI